MTRRKAIHLKLQGLKRKGSTRSNTHLNPTPQRPFSPIISQTHNEHAAIINHLSDQEQIMMKLPESAEQLQTIRHVKNKL